MALGFLISESACERNFSLDELQCEGRRTSLAPSTRFSGLKIMVDGPPLSRLDADCPSFWRKVQDRYVQKHGSKVFSGPMKRRKDAGQSRAGKKRQREGKETVTAFLAKRRQVVQAPLIPFGPDQQTIFGFRALERRRPVRRRCGRGRL